MTHPLALYAAGLGRPEAARHRLRLGDGRSMSVPLDRYAGPPDAVDHALLSGLDGPVLDVGCGPGRHLRALAGRGVFALGVDLSPAAVRLATGSGARAIVASIFDELPGAGSWRTALLLDGNIGIGGSPVRLLRRIGALLRGGGIVLAELAPPGEVSIETRARIETVDRVSRWFPWAVVSVDDVAALAGAAGFACTRIRTIGGRFFSTFVSRGRVEPPLAEQGRVAITVRAGERARSPALRIEERELTGDRAEPPR